MGVSAFFSGFHNSQKPRGFHSERLVRRWFHGSSREVRAMANICASMILSLWCETTRGDGEVQMLRKNLHRLNSTMFPRQT